MTADANDKRDDVPEPVKHALSWKGIWDKLEASVKLSVLVISFFSLVFGFAVGGWYYKRIVETQKVDISSLERRLSGKIDEADRSIENMKKIALAMAAPLLDEMSSESRITDGGEGASLEEQVDYTNRIAALLCEFGATQGEIDAIRLKMDNRVVITLVRGVRNELGRANPEEAAMFESTRHMNEWSRKQFADFIEENELTAPPGVSDSIDKLENFRKHRRFP